MAGVINHKRESSPFLYCWHVDWQVNRIFQICMCMAMFKYFFLNECVTWMCFKILLLVDRAVPKNSMDVLVMPCYQCQADKMENAERPSAMPHPHQIRRYFPFCVPNTLPSCCFLGHIEDYAWLLVSQFCCLRKPFSKCFHITIGHLLGWTCKH